MTDLNLRLRLTADGTQVQSAVRSATAALDSMSQSAKNAGISGISAAQATDRIQQSAASAARSATGASAALSSAASAIRALMGSAPAAARGLSAVSHDVRDVAAASSQADVAVQRLGSQLSSLSRIAQAALGYLGAREIVRAADEWTNITNRLRLVTDSAEELAAAQEEVFRIAREGRQSLSATAELYQRIATNQEAMGLTTAGLNRVTETISKTLAISGASAQSAEAALIQLGQAFNSGVLRGEELNSVMEQAPALARAIAQGMGKTVGELRALGAEGLLTSQQVVDAILQQGAAVDEQFGRIAPTVSQAWTVLGNAATQIIGRMDEVSGASGGAAQSILGLADKLSSPEMIQALSTFASGAAEAFRVAVESVGTFVNAIRWLGEEVAARLHGVALNDIVRMREQLREAQAELDRNTAAMSRFYAAQAPAESERAAREIWLKQEAQLRETRNQAFAEVNALTEAIQRQEQATGKAAGALSGASSALEAYTTGTTRAGALSKDAAREAEKLADSLERIRRAADPAYASMMQFEETAAILENAMSAGLIEPDQFREILNGWNAARGSAASHAESAKAAARAQKEWADSAMDAIDPMRRVNRETQRLRDAFDKGLLPDITEQQLSKYIAKIEKAAKDGADAFTNPFMDAAAQTAQALQNAIASGDWAGLGDAVGNAFAASMASVASAQITTILEDSITANSGALTQLAGAFAGPILGAVVGGVVQMAAAKIGDLFSGGDWDAAGERQAAQGAGSVLGDISAKSESIRRAVEGTERGVGDIVGINTAMLRALQGLQIGIGNAVARIAAGAADAELQGPGVPSLNIGRIGGAIAGLQTSVDVSASAALSGALSTVLGPVGSVLGGVLGGSVVDKLIGGSSRKIDEGVRILGGTISDLMDNVVVQAFATFKTRSSRFSKSRYPEVAEALGGDVSAQFSLVFQGITDSVVSAAEALSVDDASIASAINGFMIDTLTVSLSGMKPAEQRAALEQVFGKIFDDLASSVVPFADEFRDIGEGMGETLARLATQAVVLDEAMITLGSDFERALSAYERTQISDRLAELFGGVENFSKSLSGFESNFLDPAQQFEVLSRRLGQAMGELPLPTTRQGFLELVQAQDLTTESGRQAYATILQLQGVAAQYYQYLEDAAESAARAAEEAARATAAAAEEAARAAEAALAGLATATDSAMTALQSAVTARVDAAKGAYQIERAALEAKHKAALDQIKAEAASRTSAGRAVNDAFKTSAQALQRELQGISGAIGSLRDAYEPMQEARRVAAMGTLRRALGTGDLTGTGDAAQLASRIEMSAFASLADFQREQGRTLNLLSALEKEGSRQVDWAERAAASIGAQTAVISSVSSAAEAAEKQRFDEQMAELDARHAAELAELESVVTTAQDQLNALRGIETGVLAIPDAIAALAAALDQEFIARSVGTQSAIDAAYQSFGRTADAHGAQWWHDEIMSGRGSIDDLNWQLQAAQAREIMNGVILPGLNQHLSTALGGRVALPQIPQFADGGAHAGGWRVVGESGPELEFTGPSRIYSNTQSKGLFDIAPIIQELRALNQRMAMLEGYSRQTTKNTGTASRVLDRWEGGGMPAQREALV